MDNNTMILATFGGYMVLLLGIGWWGDRRFGGSYEGFVTADKSLNGWVAAISAAASSESAWVMLGLSGLGYAKGLAAFWAAIGCTLGFVVTSLFVVVQLRRSSSAMQILTLGDYLEERLGDSWHAMRVLSAVLIAFFMEVYVVAQFVGTGKQMDGMKLVSYEGGVVAGAVIIGIYVLIGGYAAVCWTDMIQGILMAGVMIIFPVVALQKVGGFDPLASALPASHLSFWAGGEGLTWAAVGFAVSQLGIGIGYPGMPHSIIRFITVRDDREAKKAAVIGLIWGALVLVGAVSLGIVGRALLPSLGDAEKILPHFTAVHFHPVVSGIILAAVSAAIMSTADSQLMMAATAIIHDIWHPLRRRLWGAATPAPAPDTLPHQVLRGLGALVAAAGVASVVLNFIGLDLSLLRGIDTWGASIGWGLRGGLLMVGGLLFLLGMHGKPQIRQTRLVILVLSGIAMSLALIQPRVIYTFVLFAWGALGASFTPVILLTLHWKGLTRQGALASFIAGPATIIVWKLVPGLSKSLYEMFPGAIMALLAAVVVSLLTAKSPGRSTR